MSTLKVDGIRSNGDTSGNDAITLTDNTTCTANITNRQNRNLIINGAMQVAQRGTSSTTSGYGSVDRFKVQYTGTDEAPTQAQHALTSSDTGPWEKGFRYSYHITNGDQTNDAGAGDYLYLRTELEAQDIANSGWNYTSASDYITLSFWVKSSVAQNFYGYVRTHDGTIYHYPFETGSLTQNQWTKVTKTIPGNANLQFDNNTSEGFQFTLLGLMGTNFTSSDATLNTWHATGGGDAYTPDNTVTWYETNDATLEITGVQLEVSDYATDFNHKSYDEELDRCFRYYQRWEFDADKIGVAVLHVSSDTSSYSTWKYFRPLRSSGSETSFSYSGASDFDMILDGNYDRAVTSITMSTSRRGKYQSEFVVQYSSAGSNDESASLRSNGSSGWLAFSAEL